MDILQRNYYRMLRNGAFGENEELEPMSNFKWQKLRNMAERDDVGIYVDCTDKAAGLPVRLYENPETGKLKSIMNEERHSIDTSMESLELLNLIIYNIEQTVNRHTSLRAIIELGRFLRIKGDKVDYIKVESWIKRLGVQRMTRLHGSVLISLFNFNIDEIPFMHKQASMSQEFAVNDRKLTIRYITRYPMTTFHSWARAIYNTVTQIEE